VAHAIPKTAHLRALKFAIFGVPEGKPLLHVCVKIFFARARATPR